jgi:hypothetical protein
LSREVAWNKSGMGLRLSGVVRAAAAASRYDLGWSVLLYSLVLVACTDCLMWFESGSLGGYSWQSLISYSLMGSPLWMMLASKGIAREQTDLMEMSKWHAIDLFPGGATSILLGHYLGKMIKMRALYIWAVVYIILALYIGAPVLALVLAFCNIAAGAINMALGQIAMKMYAPKGYAGVVSGIFSNVTWILSGAVFPLGMINHSPLLYMIDPFAAAVSTPLSLLQSETTHVLAVQAYTFLGALIWCLLFGVVTWRAERSQRARIYG